MCLKFLPMFRIVILSLLFCLVSCGGGQIEDRASVAAALKATVEDYFVSHLNLFCDDYADGVFDRRTRINDVSSLYIEPNHFFYNDRKYDSYAVWVREYIETSLHGKCYYHNLSLLLRDLQKDRVNRYTVPVELVRVDPVTAEEVGAKFRLLLTFVYQGVGQYVHIMRLDGDIPPLSLPAPKETAKPAQVAADAPGSGAAGDIDKVWAGVKSWVRAHTDRGYVMFFLSEAWLLLVDHWVVALLLGAGLLWFSFSCLVPLLYETLVWRFYNTRFASHDFTYLHFFLAAGVLTILMGSVLLGVLTATVRMDNPSRMRPHVLGAYDDFRIHHQQRVAAVKQGDKWGLVNYAGRVLLPPQFHAIGSFSDGMTWVMQNDKVGYIDSLGVVRVSPQYEGGYAFHNGQALVIVSKNSDRTIVIIDREGNVVRELPYSKIERFKGGYARVYNGWRNVGYIREIDYKEVIPPVYSEVGEFQFGYVRVQQGMWPVKDPKVGILDSLGQVVVPVEYDNAHIVDKDRVVVSKADNDAAAMINMQGQWIVPFGRFNTIGGIEENCIMAVRDGHKWGCIDRNGRVVIPLKYNRIENFSEGIATVRIGSNHGCVDLEGRLVIPLMYDEIGLSSQGLMPAQKDGFWGVINHQNETVVPFEYRQAPRLQGWGVKKGTIEVYNGRYGVMDLQGRFIIPCTYRYLIWHNGLYAARKDGKYGTLDEKGNVVHDFIYDKIVETGGGDVIGYRGKEQFRLEKPGK